MNKVISALKKTFYNYQLHGNDKLLEDEVRIIIEEYVNYRMEEQSE